MTAPWKLLAAVWRAPDQRRALLIGLLAVMGLGMGLAAGAWTRACAGQVCPSIAYLDGFQPVQAAKFYAADGRLITDLGVSRTVIGLNDMSPAIPAAYLASEDKRFFEHPGVDVIRLLGQFKALLMGRRLHGGSTVTMQLARNVFRQYLPWDRSIRRKLREIKVALELERTYSKERIFELYLNQIFMGGRAHGVEEASRRYFGKSAADLNIAEAATLAAITPRPSAFEPRNHPDIALRRRNVVLNLMRDQGFLTPEEAERWKAYPIEVSSREDFVGTAEYFVEWVRGQLYARFGDALFERGYRVYTTLDIDMQLAAERALEDRLQQIETGNVRDDAPPRTFPHQSYEAYRDSLDGVLPERTNTPYLQGALVTMDARSGYVRAMIGGRNYGESKFNRATQGLRQAGSTFKPFVYSAALRANKPASHIVVDAPLKEFQPNTGQPWEPRNFEGDYRGPMTLRKGLRQSRNLIAIRLAMEIGIPAVVGEARAYKLSTRIPEVSSVAIGSADVLLIEMVAAYTAFATLGTHAAPVGVLRVEDGDGNIVWEPQVRTERVLDTPRAWILNSMLREVVDRGTAWAAVRSRGGFTLPAGGKTGTTNDGTDVWFIGFTPELVTGMWVGFDRRRKIMENATGGGLVAPAWADYQNQIYGRRPPPPAWVQPTTLESRRVDRYTGYRATRFCPPHEVYREWYVPGTEPEEYCPYHPNPFRFGITSATGIVPPGGWGAQQHGPETPHR